MCKLTYFLKGILSFLALSLFFFSSANAQNQLEDAIKQMSTENVTGYMQPFLNGFAGNMNSGFAGTAKIDNKLTFRIDAIGMATVIGSAEEEYNAVAPSHFNQQTVRTATIFGDRGAVIQGPEGLTYQFQNGQLNLDYLPLVAPQLTIGNIFHTQLVFRFFTYSDDSEAPDIDMFGIGVRHGVNQYFKNLPVDLAIGVFYQTFNIGEMIDTRFFAINGMASRKFSLLTLYGGVQYENSNMNLIYTYSGAAADEDADIDIEFRSDNHIRGMAGVNLSLGLLHLRTDVNLGKTSILSAAVGFGI